jgi:hypothetical protein
MLCPSRPHDVRYFRSAKMLSFERKNNYAWTWKGHEVKRSGTERFRRLISGPSTPLLAPKFA